MRQADKDIYFDNIEVKPTHVESAREVERIENGNAKSID
jgi:hypothetical protein